MLRNITPNQAKGHVNIASTLPCPSCPFLLCLFVTPSLACTEITMLHSAVSSKRSHISCIILDLRKLEKRDANKHDVCTLIRLPSDAIYQVPTCSLEFHHVSVSWFLHVPHEASAMSVLSCAKVSRLHHHARLQECVLLAPTFSIVFDLRRLSFISSDTCRHDALCIHQLHTRQRVITQFRIGFRNHLVLLQVHLDRSIQDMKLLRNLWRESNVSWFTSNLFSTYKCARHTSDVTISIGPSWRLSSSCTEKTSSGPSCSFLILAVCIS